MQNLHYSENLKIRILIYLNEHEGEWIKTVKIANDFNLGIQNTRNIILSLKEDLEKQEKNIQLTISKNKGVIFLKKGNINLQKLFAAIYSHTIIFDLVKNFFYESMSNVTMYCMEKYISVSSLRRKIVFMNEALKKRGIYIKKNQICGSEFTVRSFLFQYYWEIFKDCQWPFPMVEKAKIVKKVAELEKTYGFELTAMQREQYYFFWAISKIRCDRQKYITEPIEECELFSKGNKLYTSFKKIFFCQIPINDYCENEYQYLFYGFFCCHVNFSSVSHIKLTDLYQVMAQQKNKATIISKEIFNELGYEAFLYDLDIDTSALRMDLNAVCHTAFICSDSQIFFKKFLYTENLRSKYPSLYHRIEKMLEEILVRSKEIFNKGLILEYISMLLHDGDVMSKYGKKIRVAISLSNGILNEDVLRISIKQHFAHSYNLEFSNDLQNYDILLTDISSLCLNNEKSFFLSHPRLNFKDLLVLDDLFFKIV